MVIQMIRLGYVAISASIKNSTSTPYPLTKFSKEQDFKKLDNIIQSNLNALIETLIYNEKNNIHFYRVSSNLIPLSTAPSVHFNYITPYKVLYQKIEKIYKRTNMRIDFHISQYCVLNSTRKEVITASIELLKYHYNLLKAMNIKEKIIVLHIGGNTFGKKNSLSRFINTFQTLPKYLQEIITIENDDKIFNIKDCLYLSNKLNIPVTLDYHHHQCNSTEEPLENYLEQIFSTWKKKNIPPKIHFSSPKSKKEIRSHNNYIDSDTFISFLEILKNYSTNIDIMLEAKKKDEALFRLIRELKYKTNYHFLDETTIEI